MNTVSYAHLELRENGQLYIVGTPYKVRMIVSDHVTYGWNAAQIQEEHPQLNLGQVYAALGYYYDHQEEMDREIEAGYKSAEEMRAAQGESPLIAKARAVGRELS